MKDLTGLLDDKDRELILPPKAKIIADRSKMNGTAFFAKYGSYHNAKIACEDEVCWVEMRSVNIGFITGVINNDLVRTDQHGLECGDLVKIPYENIYAVM